MLRCGDVENNGAMKYEVSPLGVTVDPERVRIKESEVGHGLRHAGVVVESVL